MILSFPSNEVRLENFFMLKEEFPDVILGTEENNKRIVTIDCQSYNKNDIISYLNRSDVIANQSVASY